MVQNTATDDGRTETKRFDDSLDGESVIEGDRIDTKLVARTLGQLGQPRQSKGPDTEVVQMTQTRDLDDVRRALLFIPETGQWLRAGRHDSNSAWSQKEADWTVYASGDVVETTEGEVESLPDSEDVNDTDKWVSGWVDIVLDELSYDAENGASRPSVSDEIKLAGSSTLHLRDADGREAYATISLEDD